MGAEQGATLKGHADLLRRRPFGSRDRGDILAFDQIWPELGFRGPPACATGYFLPEPEPPRITSVSPRLTVEADAVKNFVSRN